MVTRSHHRHHQAANNDQRQEKRSQTTSTLDYQLPEPSLQHEQDSLPVARTQTRTHLPPEVNVGELEKSKPWFC